MIVMLQVLRLRFALYPGQNNSFAIPQVVLVHVQWEDHDVRAADRAVIFDVLLHKKRRALRCCRSLRYRSCLTPSYHQHCCAGDRTVTFHLHPTHFLGRSTKILLLFTIHLIIRGFFILICSPYDHCNPGQSSSGRRVMFHVYYLSKHHAFSVWGRSVTFQRLPIESPCRYALRRLFLFFTFCSIKKSLLPVVQFFSAPQFIRWKHQNWHAAGGTVTFHCLANQNTTTTMLQVVRAGRTDTQVLPCNSIKTPELSRCRSYGFNLLAT